MLRLERPIIAGIGAELLEPRADQRAQLRRQRAAHRQRHADDLLRRRVHEGEAVAFVHGQHAATDPIAALAVPSMTRYFEVCEAWPVGKPDPIDGQPQSSDVPTLFLAAEIDPGCPPSFAKAAVARFDKKTEKVEAFPIPKDWDSNGAQFSHLAVAATHVDGKVWVKNSDGTFIYPISQHESQISTEVQSQLDAVWLGQSSASAALSTAQSAVSGYMSQP